jgi:hypothetical protein
MVKRESKIKGFAGCVCLFSLPCMLSDAFQGVDAVLEFSVDLGFGFCFYSRGACVFFLLF